MDTLVKGDYSSLEVLAIYLLSPMLQVLKVCSCTFQDNSVPTIFLSVAA